MLHQNDVLIGESNTLVLSVNNILHPICAKTEDSEVVEDKILMLMHLRIIVDNTE